MANQDPGEGSAPGSPRYAPLSPSRASLLTKQLHTDGNRIAIIQKKKVKKVEQPSLSCRARGDFKCT